MPVKSKALIVFGLFLATGTYAQDPLTVRSADLERQMHREQMKMTHKLQRKTARQLTRLSKELYREIPSDIGRQIQERLTERYREPAPEQARVYADPTVRSTGILITLSPMP